MRRIDALRFRFGTWRRNLFRPRVPVRRLVEQRPATEVTVSVVVPVKNAGPELADLITRLKRQKGFRAVEVVIVDSGSTDGSAETAEALGARLIRIAPEEFSHSYARNLGAERASGDYILFTVQDAMPPSDGWLLAMFSSLARHDAAAISCGEQPRPDSDLFYRAISWNHHRFMSPDGQDAVLFRWADETPMEQRRNSQISDIACLIGRDLFLRYRHRGNYAEDLDLGLRLTADGYRLVFLASERIVHSHNRPAYYHLRRSYVEHLALFDLLPGFPMATGDLASVTGDVVRSCAVLDALVEGPLEDVAAPATAQQVRNAMTGGLHAAAAGTPGRAAGAHDRLDPRTRALVRRLEERDPRRERPAAPGLLAGALEGIGGLFCAYLEDTGQPLDRDHLEDFKAALYKGWAQHCGVHLASIYWRGNDQAREAMRLLHEELSREI